MLQQLPQVEHITSVSSMGESLFPLSEIVNTGVSLAANVSVFGIEMQMLDVSLFVLCPLFAALGITLSSLLNASRDTGKSHLIRRTFASVSTYLANLLIGSSLGIIVALFFLGAINADVTSLAKVLILSTFLGYKSPLAVRFFSANITKDNSSSVNTRSKVGVNLVEMKQEKPKQKLRSAPSAS